MVNRIISIFFAIFMVANVTAQTAATTPFTFIDQQRSFPKITDIVKKKEDTLMKQFAEKKLQWPAKYMYIRSFKYDSQLEVWVKNDRKDQYKLFKTYRVCALAGSLGPKRMEGDYQVPEGFYRINEFNPNSMYHLSLGLNYPNISDKFLSDSSSPGGDIYIHGSCVTTGCIPIMDGAIEELYVLAAHTRAQGQEFIPVHIFPINFKNGRSLDYLKRYLDNVSEYASFANNMKNAFYYFEKYRQVPIAMVNDRGEYVVEEVAIPVPGQKEEKKVYVKKQRKLVDFDEKEIPPTVNKMAVFPGGNEAFQAYLKKLSTDLSKFLEPEQKIAYVLVEFIIDKEGNVINPKIIRGGNHELNEKLLDAFEVMQKWTPAVRLEQNVPMKLKQTIVVE